MNKKKLAFAMCGSFCNIQNALNELEKIKDNYDILPIISFNVAKIDTRFFTVCHNLHPHLCHYLGV